MQSYDVGQRLGVLLGDRYREASFEGITPNSSPPRAEFLVVERAANGLGQEKDVLLSAEQGEQRVSFSAQDVTRN